MINERSLLLGVLVLITGRRKDLQNQLSKKAIEFFERTLGDLF